MIAWLIVVAYLAFAIYCGRRNATSYIEADARKELATRERWRQRFREPHADDGKPLVDDFDRASYVLGGYGLGLIWPISLPFRLLISRAVAPTELAERDRLELEALRKLARDHGLPIPDMDEKGAA